MRLLGRLNAAEARLARQEALGPVWQVVVFALAALVMISRNPPLFTHWQFYGEDGTVWFADAYNGGWLHSLLVPAGGYLDTLQRIGGGLAMLVPFRFAPLVTNAFGLFWQCLPVTLLLSARCRRWGSLTTRMMFAAVYLAVPHAREVHVVLTNSQWHLGLVLPLLLFSEPPRSRAGQVLDATLFALAGVCGPFGILLVPAGLVFWWVRRQRWTLLQTGLLAAGVLVQVAVMLGTTQVRTQAVLGASVRMFLRLFGGDVVMGALFGAFPWAVRAPFAAAVVFAVLGLAVYGYCVWRAPVELRLFVGYGVLLLASSLHSPLGGSTGAMWPQLAEVHSSRYWFFPSLALLWGCVWCFQAAPSRVFRFLGGAALVGCCAGIVQDWRYPNYPDKDFQGSARRFEAAAPGTRVEIPEAPNGVTAVLIKR